MSDYRNDGELESGLNQPAQVAIIPEKKPLLWRILSFPLTRLLIAVLFVSFMLVGAQSANRRIGLSRLSGDFSRLLPTGVLICAGYLAYWIYVRFLERRKAEEIAPASLLPHFGLGFLLGVVLFSTTVLVLWILGAYRVHGTNGWTTLLGFAGASLTSGFLEELYLRGLFFRILHEWLGSWIALAASALLFGLLHLGNPNATLFSSIAIALEAGVLLAAAYMVTRTLWFPAGIHFAWNFVQGGLFGVAVSGNRITGYFRSELSGPAFISGGDFGAEASIVAVLVCLGAGIYLLSLAQSKGRVERPFWRKQPSADADPGW
jgi:uncharacterized protein